MRGSIIMFPMTLRARMTAPLVCACLFILSAGCQTKKPTNLLTPEEMSKEPDSRRVLNTGDALEFKFFAAEHLNEAQIIRRDGYVTLPLVGDVYCLGKTTRELQAELREKYRPELQQPQLSVILRSQDTIYVSGEVRSPGVVAMPGNMTVFESVMAAGGFNAASAEVRSVVVVRRSGNEYHGTQLDLKPTLYGESSQAFFLKPNDVVYVPRTTITKVNQWVDQHINRVIPAPGGLRFSTQEGGSLEIGR